MIAIPGSGQADAQCALCQKACEAGCLFKMGGRVHPVCPGMMIGAMEMKVSV